MNRNLRITVTATLAVIASLVLAPFANASADPGDGPYVSITGSDAFAFDVDGWAFSYQPAPGVGFFYPSDTAGRIEGCTLGFPVLATGNHRVGYLSAGHCNPDGTDATFMFTNASKTTQLPLGNYVTSVDDSSNSAVDAPTAGKPDFDYSVVSIGAQFDKGYGINLAPGVTMAGVLTVSEVRALPIGTPICKTGARTGVECGPLVTADADNFTFAATNIKGDSGGAIFVVNAAGEAQGIGLVSGFENTSGDSIGTYVDPVLTQTGLKAVVG